MRTYLFHTGRGGHFFNAGFRKCEGISKSFNPEDYGISVWYRFENLENTAEFAGLTAEEMTNLFEENGYDITDLAMNSELLKDALEKLKIKNIYGGNIESDDFGEVVLTDDAGDVLCTLEEFNSESGVLDIDGDYNKYDWKPANEIDENDFELIVRDMPFDDYVDDLHNFLDKDLAKMIVDNQKHFQYKLDKYPFRKFVFKAEDVFNVTLENFIKWSLEEDKDGDILIKGKYYSVS